MRLRLDSAALFAPPFAAGGGRAPIVARIKRRSNAIEGKATRAEAATNDAYHPERHSPRRDVMSESGV